MLKNIRKLLNIESLQEKIEDIKSIEKSLKASDFTLDSLSKEYTKEIDLYKSRDSYGSIEAKLRIEKNFGEFMTGYNDRLSKSIFYKKSLEKKRDKLLKDSKLSEIIVSIEKDRYDYNNLKKACKDGILQPNKFIDILKSKQGGKVKYSDNIVFNEDGKILILKRSRWEDKFQGAWVIPGGHVDPGEEFKEAGIRELQEESGYNVNDAELSGIFEDDNCIINYFTSHINTKEQPMILDYKETIDYRWIYPDEVDDYQMVFSMAENIKKILGVIPNFVMNIEKSKDTDKIATVMREFKSGTLTSSGKKVTDRKQAIAIAMSEAGLSKSNEKQYSNKEYTKKSEFIQKFKEILLDKGKIDEYKLKSIQYFPKGLDLENRDLIYISEDKAIYCLGGDWQIPKYVTFGLVKEDSGEELQVTGISSENPLKNIKEKINIKKEKIKLGFIDDIEKSIKDEIKQKSIKNEHSKEYNSKYLSEMIDQREKIIEDIEPDSKIYSKISDEVFRLKDELKILKEKRSKLFLIEKAYDDGFINAEQLEKSRVGIYKDNTVNKKLSRVGEKYGSIKEKLKEESDKANKKDDIKEQAKIASDNALERAAKESNDSKVIFAANKEIDNRNKGGIKVDNDKKVTEEEEKDNKIKKDEKVSSSSKNKQSLKDQIEILNKKLDKSKTYYIRFSDHIEEDLKRGWSSWNFGQEGFSGTEEELNLAKEEAIKDDSSFYISGFDLWGKDIENSDIRELYDNYWVVVDNTNAKGGLSAHVVDEDDKNSLSTIGNLLNFVKKNTAEFSGSGEGESFSPKNSKVIYSKKGLNIIESD